MFTIQASVNVAAGGGQQGLLVPINCNCRLLAVSLTLLNLTNTGSTAGMNKPELWLTGGRQSWVSASGNVSAQEGTIAYMSMAWFRQTPATDPIAEIARTQFFPGLNFKLLARQSLVLSIISGIGAVAYGEATLYLQS